MPGHGADARTASATSGQTNMNPFPCFGQTTNPIRDPSSTSWRATASCDSQRGDDPHAITIEAATLPPNLYVGLFSCAFARQSHTILRVAKFLLDFERTNVYTCTHHCRQEEPMATHLL